LVLCGRWAPLQKEAFRVAQIEGRSLVHPFDDPLVIAGNGTIGMEILKEVRTRTWLATGILRSLC
jgi:threonine dehydratase